MKFKTCKSHFFSVIFKDFIFCKHISCCKIHKMTEFFNAGFAEETTLYTLFATETVVSCGY